MPTYRSASSFREDFMNRRQFLKAAAASSLFPGALWGRDVSAAVGELQYRTLGRTGEKVSIVGVGGAHIGVSSVSERESQRIIRTAIDSGINFMDNSWSYNGGQSEIRMGKALRDGYRQRIFLMTKLDGRFAKSATIHLYESLKRLRVDHVDLNQFHDVARIDDSEKIFAPDGALEGMIKARRTGKVRYIGFTGHKSPEIHLHMLNIAFKNNFIFDTVQMPLNLMDAHYDSFAKLVLPVLVKHNIGVLGMKPMGDGLILKSKAAEPVECLQYALTLPTSVVITGCDSLPILQQALKVARTFKPLSGEQIAALLARTAPVAQKGEWELYKTSHNFDGTYQNPQWLD